MSSEEKTRERVEGDEESIDLTGKRMCPFERLIARKSVDAGSWQPVVEG